MPETGLYDPTLDAFVAELREFNARAAAHPAGPPPPPVPAPGAEDIAIPGAPISLHVLRPKKIDGVFLHFHGGGFVFGTPAMADSENSKIAEAANVAVVSVDYRLVPAVTHADQVNDGEAAALWLVANAKTVFGTEKLLIGGDSAGGNLSALTLLRLRDKHNAAQKFCGAIFNVGMFDVSMTPSQRLAPDHYFLAASRLREGNKKVFPGKSEGELRDPVISPLYADLKGLIPAIFSVGTQDAVLDDTMFMAARWLAAGHETVLEIYPEGTHLFMNSPTAMAAEARRRVIAFIRRCVG